MNPKTTFLSSLGSYDPLSYLKKKPTTQSSLGLLYPGESTANMSTPQGPATAPPPKIPNQSIVPSNTGATTTKPIVPTTPAKQQFVQSQVQNVDPNAPITGDTKTPSGATVNATTGSLVTPPPPATPDPNTGYKDAFDAYIKSLSPSTEESAASKYLADLTLQSKKDQETALGKGDTLGFATGEASRVNKNNAFAIDAAANSLNALTGNRTAMTSAQKARLDFEKSLLPDSKQSVSDKYGSGIIGEYQYAKDNGYTGTFEQYQNEDANRKKSINAGTAPKPTEAETKRNAYSTINQILGTKNAAGMPYVDAQGYFTAQGFKDIVAAAIEDGITRADILEQYADKISPYNPSGYGLTQKEKDALGI